MLKILAVILMLLTSVWGFRAQAAIHVSEGADIGQRASRVALVVGNGAYENVPTLSNTINDARDVAASLNRLGFKVIRAEDVGRREMQRAIETFLTAVTPGSEALIYFAGHGVELGGQNYLLPTDIADLEPGQSYSLTADAVSLSLLLETLEERKARVNIVILDACRNNPFKRDGTRSLGGSRGLARLDPPQGTVVIYAAAAGETAIDTLGADDTSSNGLFTRSLLQLIDQPGLEIRSMVQELKERVHSAALQGAQRSQLPSYYDGLLGKYYFVPPGSSLPESATDETTQALNRCTRSLANEIPADRLLFEDVVEPVEACRQAVANSGGSEEVARLLAKAEERMAAQKALLSDASLLGAAYLRLYPEGAYATDVRKHVASLDGEVETTSPLPLTPSLPEVGTIPPEILGLNDREIVVGVQDELNRLGCEAGRADGVWGNMGRQALANLELNLGKQVATDDPTRDLLAQLRGIEDRVCPPCFSFNQKRYCE